VTIKTIDQVKSSDDLAELVKQQRSKIKANAASIERGLKGLYFDRYRRSTKAPTTGSKPNN
jgi:hypothetical protein